MSEENNIDNVDSENPILARVREDLYHENIVAFLGPPNSGKTVVATLLNDSIFTDFLKKHKDEYAANMTNGYEFLKTATNVMLEGKFPSTKLPNNQGEIVFQIEGKGPLSHAIQINIRDISGEDYDTLLISGDPSAEKRVENVLQQHKTRSMRYGPLSFITAAKMYVVMIDCSLYSKWKQLDLNYAHLLNSLLDFQKIVRGNGEKITASIGIVLTKADCLPDEINDSAKELLVQHMPQFDKTLNMIHSGSREYFELSIDTSRTPSNEQDNDRIKVPWSYSNDEYSRLVEWILTKMEYADL